MILEYELSEISDISNTLFKNLNKIKTFCFAGDLGAGKTTLIKAMCHHLDTKDDISSPTFSILNEYNSKVGLIVHADLYRIQKIEELVQLGVEEYFDTAKYLFIEWYQIAESILEKPYVILNLESLSDSKRKLTTSIIR